MISGLVYNAVLIFSGMFSVYFLTYSSVLNCLELFEKDKYLILKVYCCSEKKKYNIKKRKIQL